MKKSMTTARTASWQYDSADYAAGMDNGAHPSYKALSKYSGNPSKQPSGSPDHIDKGRGPTKGNMGCGDEGPACPPYSSVPAVPAQGSVRDSINRGGQVRTPGGTRNWMPSAGQNYKGNPDSINSGRGPTKGNQQ
jgi:hypothetical protein